MRVQDAYRNGLFLVPWQPAVKARTMKRAACIFRVSTDGLRTEH